MRARCIVSAAGVSSGGTCPPWNLERRYISAPGAKGGGYMVKINGDAIHIEGRRPWADAPSEPIPGQRIRRTMLYPGLNWDSPEKIQQCLHCTNPDCNGRCPGKKISPLPPPCAGGLPGEGENTTTPGPDGPLWRGFVDYLSLEKRTP